MPPIGDDGYEYPLLEWCSLEQALKWIAFREWPVARRHWPHFEHHDMDVGDEAYESAYGKLMSCAADGRIALRGERLLNKKMDSVKSVGGRPVIEVADLTGSIELLPIEHLYPRAISDGSTIVWHQTAVTPEDCWCAYAHVQVCTPELLAVYPPRDGAPVRYDGKPTPVSAPKPRRLTFNVDAWITLKQAAELLRREGENEEAARNRLEYRLGQRLINVGYLVRVSPDDEDGWSLDETHIHKDDLPWQLARLDWDGSCIDFRGQNYRLFGPFNQTAEIRLLADDVIALNVWNPAPRTKLPTSETDNLAAKREEFIAWQREGYVRYGRWAPCAPEKRGERQTWKVWAKNNGVSRDIVDQWRKELGFLNRLGAPEK